MRTKPSAVLLTVLLALGLAACADDDPALEGSPDGGGNGDEVDDAQSDDDGLYD